MIWTLPLAAVMLTAFRLQMPVATSARAERFLPIGSIAGDSGTHP